MKITVPSANASVTPVTISVGEQKISIATKGVNNPFYGKKHTSETREFMSKRQIGLKRHPLSEETKKKISLANVGKKRTEDAKKKMSIAATGRPSSKKGVPDSKETCFKKSVAAKNRRKIKIT